MSTYIYLRCLDDDEYFDLNVKKHWSPQAWKIVDALPAIKKVTQDTTDPFYGPLLKVISESIDGGETLNDFAILHADHHVIVSIANGEEVSREET